MSSHLTRPDVERIAALAHLDLTEEETVLFTKQLAQILEYAEKLSDVATDDVSATWHPVALATTLRPDNLRPSLPRNEALNNSQEPAHDGLFKVPKVIG